jgi:hypothetical protein
LQRDLVLLADEYADLDILHVPIEHDAHIGQNVIAALRCLERKGGMHGLSAIRCHVAARGIG